MRDCDGLDLEVAPITATHIALSGTQSHVHASLQGRLGMVISLCAQNKEKIGMVNSKPLSA